VKRILRAIIIKLDPPPGSVDGSGAGYGSLLGLEMACGAYTPPLNSHQDSEAADSSSAQGSSCCERAIKMVTTVFSHCCRRPNRNPNRTRNV
jgi:hypothetical protein